MAGKLILLIILIINLLSLEAFSNNEFSFLQLSQRKNDTISPDSSFRAVKVSGYRTLPVEYGRVTGFDFLDAQRIICLSNSTGSFHIFNLRTRKTERKIVFATAGDYQAITVAGNKIFIACADGRIIEVSNFRSQNRSVKEYGTHLTLRQNVSGICYDRTNRRLLVSIRDIDESGTNVKGIYSFDPVSHIMTVAPVIKINLGDSLINPANSRKLQQLVQPSDLDIQESKRRIYMCSAVKSQLIVVNEDGTVAHVYGLPRDRINQPEGIRITPSGDIYVVSSGSKDEPGKLFRITLP